MLNAAKCSINYCYYSTTRNCSGSHTPQEISIISLWKCGLEGISSPTGPGYQLVHRFQDPSGFQGSLVIIIRPICIKAIRTILDQMKIGWCEKLLFLHDEAILSNKSYRIQTLNWFYVDRAIGNRLIRTTTDRCKSSLHPASQSQCMTTAELPNNFSDALLV